MSEMALQTLIGAAVTERGVRDALLGGQQGSLADFDLSDDERRFIQAIRARSLEEFAARVEEWLERQGSLHHTRPMYRFSERKS